MPEERETGKRIFGINMKREKEDLAYMVTADQCEDKFNTNEKRTQCRFGANEAEKEFRKLNRK